jgi:predicted transposase YdaD
MCKVIDDYIELGEKRGIVLGRKIGIALGIEQGRELGIAQGAGRVMIANIKELMKNLNFTIEQAMAALEIPNEKKKAYMELINA